MANVKVKDLLKNKKKKNYVSYMIALHKTAEAVSPFTDGILQQLHQQISQQLGSQNLCQQQCSRTIRDVNKWCVTCGLWRQALIRFHTNPRELIWHKLQSWEWPKQHMNLVEVFMLQHWDKANMDARDLSVSITVWKKCSLFPARIFPFADNLRKSRNKLAHSASLEIDNNDKQTVFHNINQVIQQADMVNYLQNSLEIQNDMNDLENGDLFKFEDELYEILNKTNQVDKKLHTMDSKLTEVHEAQTKTFRTIANIRLALLLFSVILVATIAEKLKEPDISMASSRSPIKASGEKMGCLQEYSPSFPTSLLLVDYFKHYGPLVGRIWLFKLLEEELKNTKKSGVLIEADMGYGKSAIAAHITCAKEGDQ
ncbi:hypothetical protein MAR_026022, partial [Mya arenaria]